MPVTIRSIFLGLGLWVWLLLPRPAPAAEYDIRAVYDDARHQIEGVERITFTHDGTVSLSEVVLFLYPNIYLAQDPAIDPAEYRKAYPIRFNPGGIDITSVTTPAGVPLVGAVAHLNGKPILFRIPLATPISPHTSFSLDIRFTTTIPEKYGVFGDNRGIVTLQGGWHPYLAARQGDDWNLALPAAPSHFRVQWTMRNDLKWIASAPAASTEAGDFYSTYLMEAEGIPFFSLSIGRGMTRVDDAVGPVRMTYLAYRADREENDGVMETAKATVRFFQLQVGPLLPMSVQMAASHLYQDLTANGSQLIYVNTRIFRVAPFLRRHHEARLARALFVLLYHAALPDEESWVIEGLAQILTEQFMKTLSKQRADLEGWLNPIAFIPLADEILYSKALPFRQVYFRETAAPALNEEIGLFNHVRPGGSAIFSKLESLLGTGAFAEVVAGSGPFRRRIREISGRNLDLWIDQWLMANPAIDFWIEDVERRRTERGYETEVTVRKDIEGPEPLPIVAVDKNKKRYRMLWEGEGTTHTALLMTDTPVKYVEIDPDRLTADIDRFNNRSPHRWKVLLHRFGLSGYDLNTGKVGYKIGFLFKPTYSDRDKVTVGFVHSETGNTGRVEYAHTFRNHHTLSGGLLYERPVLLAPTPLDKAAGIVRLGYTFSYPDTPFPFPRFAKFLRRLPGTFPTIGVSFGYDQQVTGGQREHSVTSQVDLRKTVMFSYDHEIALRLLSGVSSGGLFKKRRFFLGGDDAMRGFRPLVFGGEGIGLLSVEYRFPIRRETDWNGAGMVLTHTLQGALFADAGHVSKPSDLFDFKDYKFDAGVGLRWWLDALGFYPMLLRFDIARPIDSPNAHESDWRYYLSGGQAF